MCTAMSMSVMEIECKSEFLELLSNIPSGTGDAIPFHDFYPLVTNSWHREV